MAGFVTVELTGADLAATVRELTDMGLTLLATVPVGELTLRITLMRREYPSFRRICEKRGNMIKVSSRHGVYWRLKSFLNRPILVIGLLAIFLSALYLPSRVLLVRVEGNERVPARKILDMAGQCGIRFGASRRRVRSERMKNTLLESVPELQWAGVNTRGCLAVISVRERSEQVQSTESATFGNIVAVTDGVILECTATRGTMLCTPGQAVREGQILISGYTDTGLAIRAERASGEIFGETMRIIRVVTPGFSMKASQNGTKRKKISLLFGKKRINLWKDSGIWDATCDRMYEEYYITLPGGFQLPLGLAVETFSQTVYLEREIPQPDAQLLLSAFGERFVKQTMIAGSIHTSNQSFESKPGILVLTGEYRCVELIGVLQRLQIGEENE